MSDREELRKRLRQKMRLQRNGNKDNAMHSMAQNIKRDPATTLLQMGIDDPAMLRNAAHIVSNPLSLLSVRTAEDKADTSKPTPVINDEEEEAPPEEN